MKVLGLDASLTGTGYCLLDSGEVARVGTLKTKLRGVERLIEIRKQLGAILEGADTGSGLSLVCLEGYSYGSQGRAVYNIGELGGVIRCMFHDLWIEWVEVAPSTLKKFACGKGNVKKDQVMLHVYKRWGYTAPDNNVADAYVLAKIAQELVSPSGELTQAQEEVIKKIGGGSNG